MRTAAAGMAGAGTERPRRLPAPHGAGAEEAGPSPPSRREKKALLAQAVPGQMLPLRRDSHTQLQMQQVDDQLVVPRVKLVGASCICWLTSNRLTRGNDKCPDVYI
ncbi:unnamed protein product [Urochloa humidicola]